MNEHRPHALAARIGVLRRQSLGQDEIELDGAALPIASRSVAQGEIELRPVEGALAGEGPEGQAGGSPGGFERGFGAVPQRVRSGSNRRTGREADGEFGEAEILIGAAQQGAEPRHLGLDLRLGAEDMGVVLHEGAGPHQPLQGARGLVAMAGAEFAEAQWQVTKRADALVEDLDVPGAAHRLQGEGALAVAEDEHVVAELLPMPARLPQRSCQELRGTYLAKAGLAHEAADIVLDGAVYREAVGVPEHHARPFLLLVEEIEAIADGAVVMLVHAVLRSFARWAEGRRRWSGYDKAPSVAGGARWGQSIAAVVSARHHPTARRSRSSGPSWVRLPNSTWHSITLSSPTCQSRGAMKSGQMPLSRQSARVSRSPPKPPSSRAARWPAALPPRMSVCGVSPTQSTRPGVMSGWRAARRREIAA